MSKALCLVAFVMFFFFLLCTDALYDGRLYRCDIKFSGSNLQESNRIYLKSGSLDHKAESDEDSTGWEEREASRTHSVKFTDDVEENKEVNHAFVFFFIIYNYIAQYILLYNNVLILFCYK